MYYIKLFVMSISLVFFTTGATAMSVTVKHCAANKKFYNDHKHACKVKLCDNVRFKIKKFENFCKHRVCNVGKVEPLKHKCKRKCHSFVKHYTHKASKYKNCFKLFDEFKDPRIACRKKLCRKMKHFIYGNMKGGLPGEFKHACDNVCDKSYHELR